jgi:hypothetical protein
MDRHHLGYGRRWENNIKMDFLEMGCESVKGTELSQFKVHWRTFMMTMGNMKFVVYQSAC